MSVKLRPRPASETAPVEPAVDSDVDSVEAPTKVSETPAAVWWETLPEATVAEYSRAAIAVDRDASTPEPFKARVAAAYEVSAAKGEPVWFTQECGTVEHAEEFLKLCRLYATFKGWTLRAGTNKNVVGQARYSVKKFEARKRLTDAEKIVKAAEKAVKAAKKAEAVEAATAAATARAGANN